MRSLRRYRHLPTANVAAKRRQTWWLLGSCCTTQHLAGVKDIFVMSCRQALEGSIEEVGAIRHRECDQTFSRAQANACSRFIACPSAHAASQEARSQWACAFARLRS